MPFKKNHSSITTTFRVKPEGISKSSGVLIIIDPSLCTGSKEEIAANASRYELFVSKLSSVSCTSIRTKLSALIAGLEIVVPELLKSHVKDSIVKSEGGRQVLRSPLQFKNHLVINLGRRILVAITSNSAVLGCISFNFPTSRVQFISLFSIG